jgi:regulator of RNase E activity RraA
MERITEKFKKLSTCNISDALDKLKLKSGIVGIRPAYNCEKIVGFAVTVKITAAGETKSKSHLGVDAIDIAGKNDVLVVDNGGRKDVSCWGEILSNAAKLKGIEGIVIDGAFRDLDVIKKIGFPVYARGVVPVTARGRIMQKSVNSLIQCGGVQVRPEDLVIADENGVVVVPKEKIDEVYKVAIEFYKKENKMIEELRKGRSIVDVDKEYKYEKMMED